MAGTRLRRVVRILRGLVIWLAATASSPTAASTILLSEGFENVSGVSGDTARTVQDVLANDPSQLTPGTTIATPAGVESAINVRSSANQMNINSVIGFETPFFSSNFLAMGIEPFGFDLDGFAPRRGQFQIDLPFAVPIPGDANFVRLSFDYALDGAIQANSFQTFVVRFADEGTNTASGITLNTGLFGFADVAGGVYARHSNVVDLSVLSFTPTRVFIRLVDGGPSLATNWAGGIDNVTVRASATTDFSGPEPAAAPLIGLALASLAAGRYRSFRRGLR